MLREITLHQRSEVLTFLDRDPIRNVYLIGRLLDADETHPLDPTYVHEGDDGLDGLFSLGGILLLKGHTPGAWEAFAGVARTYDLRGYVLIGERQDLLGFWERYQSGGEPPRLMLPQRFYCLSRSPRSISAEASETLEVARETDLDEIFEAHVDAVLEETGQDVLADQPEETRERVLANILAGRVFLIRRDGKLAFKAEIGTVSPAAATIVGVYTPPPYRGQGLATRGMAELCRRTMVHQATLCLCVNEDNLPAIRIYEKLGFRQEADFLAIFIAD